MSAVARIGFQQRVFAVATSFLRANAAAIIALLLGILAAPDLDAAVALSVATAIAVLTAGIRLVQTWLPKLSTATLGLGQPWAAWADSFLRAFAASILTFATGWLAAPDWATLHSALVGVVVGAIAAGLRAVQGLLTAGESPRPGG